MPNLIVSTCGTSLLTNGADVDMRRLLIAHANETAEEMDRTVRGRIDAWVDQRCEHMREATEEDAARLSAEINGLQAYYHGAGTAVADNEQDQHWLVVTDTYLGQRAFECIGGWLDGRFQQMAMKVTAGGLNTSRIADFRAALADIVNVLDELDLAQWRRRGYRVVFNLTGGFKSVNGFMQTIGMLFADECFYLFEGSGEVMRVPRLPISLDAATPFRDNLDAVRRMANGKTLTRDECGTLPETLLFVVDDSVQLSEWGAALWLSARPEIYRKALMEPLSDRLWFSESFMAQVGAGQGVFAQPDRLDTLNQRLDDLARHLDTNGAYNPQGLHFHGLEGNPVPPCTHEFYVWSDLGHRGYGFHENVDDQKVFVVQKIGPHL